MVDPIPTPHGGPIGRPSNIGTAVCVAAVAAGTVICLAAVAPLGWGLALAGVFAWFTTPGVLFGRRLYGSWGAALLAGPAWGYVFSTLALLGLWAAGIRSFRLLMLAPAVGAVVLAVGGRFAPQLSGPRLTRRDIGAVALTLMVVPLVVGRPYARVGEPLAEGRAYRAYFTADLVWAVAVVAELEKGDFPPRNPYYVDDELHYYWLTHLPAAVGAHALRERLSTEQVVLVGDVLIGLFFTAFFYFFVRHFVDGPFAAAIACAIVVFCSSFEGLERLWSIWRRNAPLEELRLLNIDAVTNWVYGGMKIDGLHRLLLYQPQHQLTYVTGLSALLVIDGTARIVPRAMFWAGAFIGLAMLLSSFAALMAAAMVASYAAWRIWRGRQWRAILPGALAAGVPMFAALFLTRALGYVDAGDELVRVGPNPLATSASTTAIGLGFGPVLLLAGFGYALARRRQRADRFSVLWAALGICALFYFFVDLPDSPNSVGWHAGKLAFIALTPLCGVGFERWATAGTISKRIAAAALVLVALAALPTVVIDLYNTQDVFNRQRGPGFRWTVLVTPDEVDAIDWIRQWTPKRARVQVDPVVRGRDSWAFVPAFAERRMSAGLPISMIPLDKYERASEQIRTVYQSTAPTQAYERALSACIDYLVLGPPEQAAYPHLRNTLDAARDLFVPAFHNNTVAVYWVPHPDGAHCRR